MNAVLQKLSMSQVYEPVLQPLSQAKKFCFRVITKFFGQQPSNENENNEYFLFLLN